MNCAVSCALAALLALCSSSAANAGSRAATAGSEAATAGSEAGAIASSTLYVARRGWHIDIGLAAADLSPPLAQAAADVPGARFVFFGFADKHYLLAKNHNAPVLFSALFPGAGILLTTGLTNSPVEAFGATHVIMLTVPQGQMRALQSFIWRTLRTQDDVLKVYREGPYPGSVYFLAAPKYSALHTCNTWGAEALRAAGFRVHTAGVVFASQLWVQARRLKRLQDRAAAPGASPQPQGG
ncbi:MAG TPA: DUF2459 domain-containing protein [Steroidobacteraceae bacterium]|nr:DUF2459 domain-containing protein [Steroidobacteraceae bacterium]